MIKINNKWDQIIKDEIKKDYFVKLMDNIFIEYEKKIVYPDKKDIFRALELTDFDKVKVVILGQDPYHGFEQAKGLAFSVKNEIKSPPSLKNIFKELKDDLNIEKENNDLESWANQGVFLLNSVLTVEEKNPLAHKNIGWEIFTDFLIKEISTKLDDVVFVLWGNYAKTKKELIDEQKHLIIESSHPSPFSSYRGFFGSKPFSKINEYLKESGKEEINW